jgi:hypothetical protein
MNFITTQTKGDVKSKKSFNSACKLLGLFDLNKKQWDDFKKSNTNISETFILKKLMKDY